MAGVHGQVEESSLITTPAPETASWMMMLGGASALSVPPCAIGVIPRRASPDTPPTQGVPATVHLIETELGNREVCRGAPDAEISAVSPGNYGASLLNSLLYARGIGRSSRFVDLVNWHRNPPMPPQAVARRHGQSRASTWRRRCGLYPHIAFRPFRFEPRLPPLTRCGYQ